VNSGAVRIALIVLGLLGTAAFVRVAARPLVRIEMLPALRAGQVGQGRDSVRRIGPESLSAIVSRDPFRIGRRPAVVAYDPVRLAEQLAPVPPKPALTLVGVVSGSEPSAVVEGLPGVEGSRVLRVGDVVAGLQIKQIGNGRVVIVGMDTTWVLEVREPWKN
jgi:hypothetical protein